MAKKIYDICLVPGTDKEQFIDSFDAETEACLHKKLNCIDCCVSMSVEEEFLEALKNDSRVHQVDERLQAFPASIPPLKDQTAKITVNYPSTSDNGYDYAPLQFYVDTDKINTDSIKVGRNSTYDSTSSTSSLSWKYRWTGKNVDIVTLEVGPVSSSYAGDHDTHPDFDSISNPGNSRVIPMNWPGLESPDNNQVSSNSVFSSHAMGVLSAAAGTICGFAKEANLRVAYIGNGDDPIECMNEIINWHNSKENNPETGVPNPTILIAEYQYLQDRRYAVNVDDIESITTAEGTVSRPGSSWGNDLRPFVSRNIIPFKVYNPDTGTYSWRIVFPNQFVYSSLKAAYESAWDAGIVCINAAGNNGGVYVKDDDPEFSGTYCTMKSSYTTISINYNVSNFSFSDTSPVYYPFISYGPHGVEGGKGIDVAAGYNSEGLPILDGYSNRGKGIDIIGLGANTWTAYPLVTYADGNLWGMFSGTSCATPTVVGKAACIMEREFYYSGIWPSPDKVKELLLKNGKRIARSLRSTNWSNVPSASSSISNASGGSLLNISTGNGNGGYTFTELAGTPEIRSFFDPEDFIGAKQNVTKNSRPTKGGTYPRLNSRYGSGSESFAIGEII